ncbi:cbb3-type cytochrome c oxidase subunit III [Melioribacter roseus P3M-2]|uniref:Cbb3-type cytochrome c oxidase subunit III n=2 Tax=Melioribacteraceae TaxID=1334117 RepID=I6YVY3_MELRP|nr:cbb3-type cytochrome c oxidase subunit III [Melioribacter roseus P3M-2]
MKMDKIKSILAVILLSPLSSVFAAGNEEILDSVMKTMIVITLLMIAFVLWLAFVYSEKNDSEGKLFLEPFRRLIAFLDRSAPLDKEQEMLLDHNYDGIRELDNRVPPWFQILFYGTIIWAAGYLINYHVIGDGQVQLNEYKYEIEQANLQREILIKSGAFINEETVSFVDDAAALSEGKEIFVKNCASCHGQNGEGLIGPNLTDDYWIHGGGIKNIFKVIKYGVPQKGMISWESQIEPKKIQAVASYIITLHGTNPPNPKAPEGELWNENKPEGNKGA